MYHSNPTIDITAIITGVIGLLTIITFFVMAFRLKNTMQATASLNKIFRARAIKEGLITIKECPQCHTHNDIFEMDSRPIICSKCDENLSKAFPDLT